MDVNNIPINVNSMMKIFLMKIDKNIEHTLEQLKQIKKDLMALDFSSDASIKSHLLDFIQSILRILF